MSEIKRIKFTRSFAKNGRQWQQGDIGLIPDDLTPHQAEVAVRRGQAVDVSATPEVKADGPKKTETVREIKKTKATTVTATDTGAKSGSAD